MAIIIKIIPPIVLEYDPIFLPRIVPRVRPRYVKVALEMEKIIEER